MHGFPFFVLTEWWKDNVTSHKTRVAMPCRWFFFAFLLRDFCCFLPSVDILFFFSLNHFHFLFGCSFKLHCTEENVTLSVSGLLLDFYLRNPVFCRPVMILRWTEFIFTWQYCKWKLAGLSFSEAVKLSLKHHAYKAKPLGWNRGVGEDSGEPWRVGRGKFCLRSSIWRAFCPCGLPLSQLTDLPCTQCFFRVRKRLSLTGIHQNRKTCDDSALNRVYFYLAILQMKVGRSFFFWGGKGFVEASCIEGRVPELKQGCWRGQWRAMASRRGQILLAVFYLTRVLPMRLATVSTHGLALHAMFFPCEKKTFSYRNSPKMLKFHGRTTGEESRFRNVFSVRKKDFLLPEFAKNARIPWK